MKLKVELKNRDYIEAEVEGEDLSSGKILGIELRGCTEFMSLIREMRLEFGQNIRNWPLPQGTDHSSLLIKEFILKLNGKWIVPDLPEEICHCRSVSYERIDEAIISGAHSTAKVTRLTNASSNCGTCRGDVQKLIDFRLQTS